MRTSALELVEATVTEQPESLRQLANVIDREYREDHRNLEELES